ncbi:MAG: glycosyltransferase [Bacteroidales bacterium]
MASDQEKIYQNLDSNQQSVRHVRKIAGKILRLVCNGRLFMSKSQKKKLKKKRKQAKRKAKHLKYQLLNLGFTERAIGDLEKMLNNKENPYNKEFAARVLARWHANQYNKEGAKYCLENLVLIKQDKSNTKELVQTAIMKAECHELLGNTKSGRKTIIKTLKVVKDSALYLAIANFEPFASDRLRWINQALIVCGLSKISYDPSFGSTPYDCLKPVKDKQLKALSLDNKPTVTVIVPVYNAESMIRTALNSILAQTWPNLEVIVVDDCSTDNTLPIIKEYCAQDRRVRFIKATKNGGPYVARNLALKEATGNYVTCHDADDWSHPEKIEKQALHLLKNPEIVGNTSQQARTTSDLKFYRGGRYNLIYENLSSFMFRIEPVMKNVGFWDCVRFGADTEFFKRNIIVFGTGSVVSLPSGPLSFTRQHTGSLTKNEPFGFNGFYMGARKEYLESMNHHHQTAPTLRFEFPQEVRPFPAPEVMWSEREPKLAKSRHFDVIIASDFRLPGGTTSSNAEEIKAQKQLGLRTGLIQLSRYGFDPALKTNPKIRDLIDGEQVQMLVYGEGVICECLVVKHPPVLQERQRYVPDVVAKSLNVIINQAPLSDYGPDASRVYDIERCQHHLHEYFGQNGKWHPIGPLIRETLQRHHFEELASIDLADEDWVEIINVDEWRRPERPERGRCIRIGRHSRENYFKWPANPDDLLAAYPEEENYEVHLLGGADTPLKTLGYLPQNWHVSPFGSETPKDFLAKLDVFVYFTHPDMVEAFGRVIIEAMAVGVPVILPPSFSSLFGDAAIYAEPSKVIDNIERLMNNNDYYCSQVEKAQRYVEKHFGYQKHAERLKELSVSI